SGIYQGRTFQYQNQTIYQYLGIQYAKVTKRFHRAVPIIRNESNVILQADRFGPVCKPSGSSCNSPNLCTVAYGIFTSLSLVDEDCLYLNIFLPITTNTSESWSNSQRKAIFIWIHGGSGQIGTGNLFDGSIFAAVGDVIVVTFNFRLNLYGFLSSGDDRLEGNLGLYDQLLVLDWLYDNADQIGGDRERIVLGGHSAVAIDNECYYTLNENDEKLDFSKTLDCLSKKDFQTLNEHEHHSYISANHTNVVHQQPFLTSNQNETYLLDNTNYSKIDILMGSVADEGLYIAVVPMLIEQEDQGISTLNLSIVDVALKFLANIKPDSSCLYQDALKLYQINEHICLTLSNPALYECKCSLFLNYSKLISDILFYNDYHRYVVERLKKSSIKKQ
ncbi:unnamed protein product, partial [Didymodactylos carnosus]